MFLTRVCASGLLRPAKAALAYRLQRRQIILGPRPPQRSGEILLGLKWLTEEDLEGLAKKDLVSSGGVSSDVLVSHAGNRRFLSFAWRIVLFLASLLFIGLAVLFSRQLNIDTLGRVDFAVDLVGKILPLLMVAAGPLFREAQEHVKSKRRSDPNRYPGVIGRVVAIAVLTTRPHRFPIYGGIIFLSYLAHLDAAGVVALAEGAKVVRLNGVLLWLSDHTKPLLVGLLAALLLDVAWSWLVRWEEARGVSIWERFLAATSLTPKARINNTRDLSSVESLEHLLDLVALSSRPPAVGLILILLGRVLNFFRGAVSLSRSVSVGALSAWVYVPDSAAKVWLDGDWKSRTKQLPDAPLPGKLLVLGAALPGAPQEIREAMKICRRRTVSLFNDAAFRRLVQDARDRNKRDWAEEYRNDKGRRPEAYAPFMSSEGYSIVKNVALSITDSSQCFTYDPRYWSEEHATEMDSFGMAGWIEPGAFVMAPIDHPDGKSSPVGVLVIACSRTQGMNANASWYAAEASRRLGPFVVAALEEKKINEVSVP